jgi:L-amino acid N-acyltransferase YncA
MSSSIRLASRLDAASIAEIYAPHCDSAPVSFEAVAPSVDEMAARIDTIGAQWPWLVLEDEGVVAGYAYASRHHERAAYAWAVDTAIYVGPPHRRQRVGLALYTTLLDVVRRQGYFKACAGITLPNPASVGLHEAVGFSLVGVYRGIGYKQGAWHDVAWYEAEVQPEIANPAAPRPVWSLHGSAGWQEAVALGLARYVSRADADDRRR